MEIFGVEVPLWVSLTFTVTVLLYWYGTSTFNTFQELGIPHRKAYIPFFGHLIENLVNPLPILDMKISKQFPGKIYGGFEGRRPALYVRDAEFVKDLTIREFASFMNRRLLMDENGIPGNHLGRIKDDHWKHIRTILSPSFSTGKLKQMYPIIQSHADRFVSCLHATDATPVLIKDYTAGYTMDVIASTAFGLDIQAQRPTEHPFMYHAKSFFATPRDNHISTKIQIVLNLLYQFMLPIRIKALISKIFDASFVGQEANNYFETLMNKLYDDVRQKEQKGIEFITRCAEKVVDLKEVEENTIKVTNGKMWTSAGLTKRDFIANATLFISDGFEPTSSTLQSFFYFMAMYPDVQDKLHRVISELADENGCCTYEELKQLEYLDWCIDESMRLMPVGMRLEREAEEDVTIRGIPIKKGMVVHVQIYCMHRDPTYWEDPETFKPERFAPENRTANQQYAFLPFGSGGRKCIGYRLALLEMKVVIVKALTAFRFERCSETPKMKDLTYKLGLLLLNIETPVKLVAVPKRKL
ncbi:CYP3A4 [Bugula neritina]|uniref:CYP3A4 n=1 Tax=Bugula neritina TaxID=10212 RepID=A0A7J7IWZ1_BUGNE|nr:CYP3A4 [Bugula neritina]